MAASAFHQFHPLIWFTFPRDLATFDQNLQVPVNYTVATPGSLPENVTYGPSYITFASELTGDVTLGLNRRLNNMVNTVLAALLVKETINNVFSIELGNEPECGLHTVMPIPFVGDPGSTQSMQPTLL